MRALYIVLLIILTLCALMKCVGCGKEFARVTSHQDRCARYQALLGTGLKRRAEEEDVEHTAKARRIQETAAAEAARIAQEDHTRAVERERVEVCTHLISAA